MPLHTYLGDAVYASFDGDMIHLAVGDHRNPPVVALEREVVEALARFAAQAYPNIEYPRKEN